jgi:hypothetical protein
VDQTASRSDGSQGPADGGTSNREFRVACALTAGSGGSFTGLPGEPVVLMIGIIAVLSADALGRARATALSN